LGGSKELQAANAKGVSSSKYFMFYPVQSRLLQLVLQIRQN